MRQAMSNIQDMMHRADDERKRRREEDRPAMVSLPFKVWEQERKELQQLRKRVAELEDA